MWGFVIPLGISTEKEKGNRKTRFQSNKTRESLKWCLELYLLIQKENHSCIFDIFRK